MNKIAVVLLLSSVQSILAISNVKSSPISISNKPDLNVEEARFSREPTPEYYDRDRQNFVTSYGNTNSYGLKYGGVGNMDRDRYNTNRYGTPSTTGYDTKYYMPGGIYNKDYPNSMYGPNFSKYPTDSYGYGMGNYPPGPFDMDHGGLGGLGGKDKSLWLPLAGAALIGVAAALIANPMYLQFAAPYGKRKRRSTEDNMSDELAYQGYVKK